MNCTGDNGISGAVFWLLSFAVVRLFGVSPRSCCPQHHSQYPCHIRHAHPHSQRNVIDQRPDQASEGPSDEQ